MVNPNPARITDPMWSLWEKRPDLSWRLSGIYADKPGYHNTVNANLAKWPMNYSVKLSHDLTSYNRDKARAIDLTQSDASMVQWTTRMRDSALDPKDTRLAVVREFYGTLDNKTVFGLIKDNLTGPWRHSTSNLTHLFHGHTSIFTIFVNNWITLAPLISVWSGESFAEWSEREMFLPNLNDEGEEVKHWQYMHNYVRELFGSSLPELTVDGKYGSKTATAFIAFWKAIGGTGTYNGNILTGSLALEYQKRMSLLMAKSTPPLDPVVPVVPVSLISKAVDDWFKLNFNSETFPKFTINGEVAIKPVVS